MKNCKNVLRYTFGQGALQTLPFLLEQQRSAGDGPVLIFIDRYFEGRGIIPDGWFGRRDGVRFVDTVHEPKTSDMDRWMEDIRNSGQSDALAVVGIGGGATLDTAKAVANLLTNTGKAEDYQGWDLVRHPAVYKIGIPTLSGTGAESSRTCVMTNVRTGLKLGMNSDHTIYDQLILDPDLTRTVPRNQYFHTGVDTYIHCIESLAGRNRHPVGDAFSHQANELSRQVFLSDDMMSDMNRERLMVASYLGGCAIANSYVGLVHPFSAGLSVVLGTHHGVGNCIALLALEEYYPQEHAEFVRMVERQGVEIPRGVCSGLADEQFARLHEATIIHEVPLRNALGDDFGKILTPRRTREIFERM